MPEVLIIHNQIQQTSTNSAVQSELADQFVEKLRVGQNLKAQLVVMENKYWLVTENYRIAIPKETVEQWNLVNNQFIKLKVSSLANPLELQLVNNKLPKDLAAINSSNSTSNTTSRNNSEPLIDQKSITTQKPLADQNPLIGVKQLDHLKTLTNLTAAVPLVKEPKSTTDNQKSDSNKQVQVDKVDTNKLITEARKLLNNPILDTKASSPQSIQPKAESSLNETLLKTSDKAVISTVDNKAKLVIETKDKKLSQLVQTALTRNEASNTRSSILKPISDGLPTLEKPQTVKSTRLIAPQPKTSETAKSIVSTKDVPNIVVKDSKLKSEHVKILNKTVVIAESQAPSKTTVSNTIKATNLTSSIAISSKPMKFEIAVSLPDKERFPVLAEKITTAYNRQLEVQKPTSKSMNNLLSQLERLNQWSVDNKASRRTQNGAQVEKLASSLKESLKDMFRYISPKESLKTAKSVEKAIQQSGTFLEKRIAKQETAKKDILNKSSTGLTIHKDFKANLNRVLTTALYNLAKLNSATSTSTNTAEVSKNLTASTQTEQKILNAQKQLTDSSSLLKSNLLNNIRSSLIKLSSGKSAQINIAELESITKQVLKDTQSALARTQLSQLTNLRPETAQQQWLFELPVFNDSKLDIFNLYMKQYSKEEDEEQSKKTGWSIVLQFDIGALGKIRAMLSWEDDTVQVRFIAENKNTVSLVDDELSYFQSKLSDKDISFEELSVEQSQLDDLNFQFSKGNSND